MKVIELEAAAVVAEESNSMNANGTIRKLSFIPDTGRLRLMVFCGAVSYLKPLWKEVLYYDVVAEA